ncbi:hypothetical protein [Fimbriiglobus ruber]|uniref:Serine/threonine protein kinase PrkC, regulator of stationary phase n=1 Tax=Fimbriiglobus ruber TaxID=1908690 RepID=A0A225DQF2_9BACT|nr:hypothetical protein [Fimbriiglobus ruber]OWK38407.1 Serine/threonine protein kinase PrkC, regulator of stationary phase [Fimbriiglobus ruber]
MICITRAHNCAAALPFAEKAVELAPEDARAFETLGRARMGVGNLTGAVAAFEKARRLDPKHAGAQKGLVQVRLLGRLPAVVAGTARPATPAETLRFAELCGLPYQKRYLAAAQLSEKAFAAAPKLAVDLVTAARYTAACSAARAASGDGVGAPSDPAARATWRAKALGWLRADLILGQKSAASSRIPDRQAAAAALTHWLGDADLSAVRPGLARMAMTPVERSDWDAVWADVRATIVAARQLPPPPDTAPPPRPK